jgi:hypothetical protein
LIWCANSVLGLLVAGFLVAATGRGANLPASIRG